MFNFHIFVNVLAFLLLLIFSFIPLCLEKISGITSVFKNFLSNLVYVSCALEKNVCFATIE